jgi:N-acetylmuramoyl-L-alanine amidase
VDSRSSIRRVSDKVGYPKRGVGDVPPFHIMRIRIYVIVSLMVIVVASPCWLRAQQTIVITHDDDRAPETVPVWTLPADGEMLYLRANDVARLFKATQFWNATSRKVVLGVGRTRFILTVDTRVVVIDGEPVMLRSPVRYQGGFVMIPLEFIMEVASHYTPRTFTWDPDAGTLSVRGLGYNIERITFSTAVNRTTATIDLTEPLLYHMDANTPGLVRLKLYGGRVDTRELTYREARGLIDGVRAEQTERDAYIYFAIKRNTSRLRIDRKEDPDRIVLVLEKGELPEIPDAEFEGSRVVEIVDETTAERRSIDIKTVVIDPGHGGKDYGKTGVGGLLEKDVNMMLAKVIRDRIEQELGLEVILTREDDRLVSLTARTEIANEAGEYPLQQLVQRARRWIRSVLLVAGQERVGAGAGAIRECRGRVGGRHTQRRCGLHHMGSGAERVHQREQHLRRVHPEGDERPAADPQQGCKTGELRRAARRKNARGAGRDGVPVQQGGGGAAGRPRISP